MTKTNETPYLEVGEQGIIDGIEVIARKCPNKQMCYTCTFLSTNGMECNLGMFEHKRKCSREDVEVYYEAVEEV